MDIEKESEGLVAAVKVRMQLKTSQVLLKAIAEVSGDADVMILQGLGIDAKDFLLNTIIAECNKLSKGG